MGGAEMNRAVLTGGPGVETQWMGTRLTGRQNC